MIDLDTIRQGHASVAALFDQRPGLFIADAETEDDLRTLARAAVSSGIRLLCGSAGLARALQECAELSPKFPSPELREEIRGPTLIVAGSRHHKTVEQVEFCGKNGIPIVRLPETFAFTTDECDGIVAETTHQLSSHRTVILTSHGMQSEAEPNRIAQVLGRITESTIETSRLGGLVITGGQTSLAVCEAVDAGTFWLKGEVAPGLAWGRLLDGHWPGLLIVTGAGSFLRSVA